MVGKRCVMYATFLVPFTALFLVLQADGEGVPGSLAYLGCFTFTNETTILLNATTHSNASMNVALCQQFCNSNNQNCAAQVFALNDSACLCLHTTCTTDLSSADLVPNTSCSQSCPGNQSQICGGADGLTTFYSIYSWSSLGEATNLPTSPMVILTTTMSQSSVAGTMTSMSVSQSVNDITMTQTSQTTVGMGSPNRGTVVAVVLVVILVILIIVVIFAAWNYCRRKKQSHSFHEHDEESSTDHQPSFRVLSTWAEAVQKVPDDEDPSPLCNMHANYGPPDLIVGTSENKTRQNEQYGRLRNDTITSESSNLPTTPETELPPSSEFENPTFEMEIEGIFDNSLFNSTASLDNQTDIEERFVQSENEHNFSKSPMSLANNVSISEIEFSERELRNTSCKDGDDQVSTGENGLSVDLQADIEDQLRSGTKEDDTNSEETGIEIDCGKDASDTNDTTEIETGFDNVAFEMDTDLEGDDDTIDARIPSLELEVSR